MTGSHPALSQPISGSDPSLVGAWDQIVVPPEDKRRLLNHALLALTLRGGAASPTSLPVHGLLVLAGPPGTGKTTLARGLSSQNAEAAFGIRLQHNLVLALDAHVPSLRAPSSPVVQMQAGIDR